MNKTIIKLQKLVKDGFTDWKSLGNITVKEKDNLLIFNYNVMAVYEGTWNEFELVSRGLVLDTEGNLIALPFGKFFNWGENGRKTHYSNHLKYVFEKMDGSLGILYRQNGEHKVATRGSFDSEQAIWATEHLQKYYNLSDLPENLTLLFEIIYPENRIVVDYGDFQGLVLLTVFDMNTHQELEFYPDVYNIGVDYGFELPQVYQFNNVTDVLATTGDLVGVESEGYVLLFSNGERFKIKGDEYIELHKLLSNFTYKNIITQWNNIDTLLLTYPEEFHEQIYDWIGELYGLQETLIGEIETILLKPKLKTRKDLAVWLQKNYPEIKHYVFAYLDQKVIDFTKELL